MVLAILRRLLTAVFPVLRREHVVSKHPDVCGLDVLRQWRGQRSATDPRNPSLSRSGDVATRTKPSRGGRSRAVCWSRTTAFSALLIALAACKNESEKEASPSVPSATATTTGPVVNPEIAQAVAEAAKAPAAATTRGDDGPPPDGILGKERADKEIPAGAAVKVTLGQAGSDPKVQLGGPSITDQRIGQMTVSTRLGPMQAAPTVSFRFELQGVNAEGAAEGAPPEALSIGIVESSLAAQQPGQIPKEMADAVTSLEGSRLVAPLQQGVLSGAPRIELGKKSDAKMEALLRSAANGLTHALIEYPSEPVGKGGFWLVTAREDLGLGEVVSYRLIKVESIAGNRVTLSVNTKHYLASDRFQDRPAVRFQGTSDGEFVVMPGHRLPIEGNVQQSLQALLDSGAGQPRPAQWEIRALFAFPSKPVDASKDEKQGGK